MKPPAFGGLVIGTLMLAASLTPSLLPRHWLFQAVVSGIVTAVGYGLGVLGSHLWRRLPVREPSAAVKRAAWRGLAVLAPLVVLTMSVLGMGWQRELHQLMSMPVPPLPLYILGVAGGVLLAMALVAVARRLRLLARHLGVLLSRWVPPAVAGLLGGVLVALLVVGVLDGVVRRGFFAVADRTFLLSDRALTDDAVPPTSPARSGSAASLVRWADLGSQGRAFVSDGPDRQDLAALSGAPMPRTPIRVYVGLASAEDVHDRAELVVAELERTGAFDRAVLCVMVTTGTGWVDPAAATALEHLWAGDSALAAMQYSYLPSWLSLLVDSSRAREAGAVLFNTVYEHWRTLPLDERPRLLVFGESLGADGAEAAFSGVADLRNRTDGVLLVGPPSFSELWAFFTENRDPGTPQRLPVFDGGETVRFAAQPEDLARPDAPWRYPRVVYLQHASDPVVWWSPRLILRRPDWLEEPPGPDVLPAIRWFPLVTFWQVSADLANAGRVPPGHGHVYAGLIADAWAAIAAPPGWSATDTARLHTHMVAELAG